MIIIAPSSTPLRPSFQASTTRIEYCSIASGAVVGTINTASCAPLRSWKSARCCSSSACCAEVSVPVRSVTCALRGGIGCSCCAPAGSTAGSANTSDIQGPSQASSPPSLASGPPRGPVSLSNSRRARGLPITGRLSDADRGRRRSAGRIAAVSSGTGRRRRVGAEINGRRVGDLRLILHGEVLFGGIFEHHRREIHREGTYQRVVCLDLLDIAMTRHCDAVFSALELGLQIAEVLVGLQLRIVLGDSEQTLERLRQLPLCLLEALEGLRVVDQLRRHLDGAHLGARFRDADQHLLLLRGITLNGIDEIRHQIRPALVLIDHL